MPSDDHKMPVHHIIAVHMLGAALAMFLAIAIGGSFGASRPYDVPLGLASWFTVAIATLAFSYLAMLRGNGHNRLGYVAAIFGGAWFAMAVFVEPVPVVVEALGGTYQYDFGTALRTSCHALSLFCSLWVLSSE